MPRGIKNTTKIDTVTPPTTNLPTQQETLTYEETWSVLEFAKQFNGGRNAIYPSIFTPELVNSRMKDLNMNPLQGTQAEIEQALANPKSSETQLIGYSEFFELTDMLYKRQILYLGNLLAWDWTYTCTNAKKEDYAKPAYKADKSRIADFMDKFDVKKEFSRVLRQLLRQETFYCNFRQEGNGYVLQELPLNYCKLTGRWEHGLLFDFNMQYFLSNPGVDIDMYPKSMKKMYNNVMDSKNKGYVPSSAIDKRTGEWVLWSQTSPEDGFWAWKFTPEIAAQVPFFSPMFPDLVLRPMVRNLQTNLYMIEASKLLMGLIGFNKDNKSGNVRDSINLSPDTAGKFANLVRQALNEQIKFAMSPFDDVKAFEWDAKENILDKYNKVTVSQGGTNTRLLYATDKMNAIETKNSIAIDEQVVKYIYKHFEDFLNYYVNKLTRKYKFKFTFEGTDLPDNRQHRIDVQTKNMEKGLLLPQKIAASQGMNIFDMERMMEEADADNWYDRFKPLQSSFTMSGKGASPTSAGQPKKADGDLGDAGITTRDAGSNED